MTKISFRQRYEKVERIGAGGMGEVFKGYDKMSSRWIAIKVLHPAIAADQTAMQRFEREIKTQGELYHTNIATLFGVEDFKEGPCMIMQYVNGPGLNRLFAPGKPLPPGICLRILDGVLAGMGYAHSSGIIHRDLKPSNILIGQRGVPKIIDFGIAKPEGDQDMTMVGGAPGTVSYMAPEQHTSQPASIRSDVFSLGIICYEMFTGEHPFRQDSPYATTRAIVSQDPVPIRKLAPELPEALEKVILRALDKNPAARQRDAEELRVGIGGCGIVPASEQQVEKLIHQLGVVKDDGQEGFTGQGKAQRPGKRGSRWLQLNWMISAGVILLLTAAAVAYLVIGVHKPEPHLSETTAAPVNPKPVPGPAAEGSTSAGSEEPGATPPRSTAGGAPKEPAFPAPAATANPSPGNPAPGTPVQGNPAQGGPAPAGSPPTAAPKTVVDAAKIPRPPATKRAPKADPVDEREKKRIDTLNALSGKSSDNK